MEKLRANTKKEDLIAALEAHQAQLTGKGFSVAGIFLQGEQNYGLDTPGSGVHAYAVLLPGEEQFTYDLPMTVVEKDRYGTVTAKDIRLFAADLLTAEHAVLELLLTPYRIVDWPCFKSLLNTRLREDLLTYDMAKTVTGISKEAAALWESTGACLGMEAALAKTLWLYQAAWNLAAWDKSQRQPVSDFFCHALQEGPWMDEARQLKAGSMRRDAAMGALGQHRADAGRRVMEWLASYEADPEAQAETKRQLASWVQSAFSLHWMR